MVRTTPTAGAGASATDQLTPVSRIESRTPPPEGRLDPQALDAALAPVRQRYGSQLAVAWAPVGRPDLAQVVGQTQDIESWSMLKAPIALAVVQDAAGEPSTAQRGNLRAALTMSDNDAAVLLWQALAEPSERVGRILAAGGDATTHPTRDAQGRQVSFGLTAWKPVDAARFAAGLPCLPQADRVLNLMGHVIPEQQWGLGRVADARFKGGWGPSPHGYLSRQFGVLPRIDGGQVAVSLAVQPKDDSHESASAALDETTRIFMSLLGSQDSGRCSAPSSAAATDAAAEEGAP